jgi:DNA-directed RNA polymerase specialized sigma54-like protein
MSPQLRQAIRLLELSRLELIAEIRREIDTTTTTEPLRR